MMFYVSVCNCRLMMIIIIIIIIIITVSQHSVYRSNIHPAERGGKKRSKSDRLFRNSKQQQLKRKSGNS